MNQVHGAQARVVPFSPAYAADFEALDRQWIEQHFAADFARRAEARTLMLISNTRPGPAVRLYARHGFRVVPLQQDSHGRRIREGSV
uniref:Uncharacterized protein n=1 Tax=uncultured Armatimonadetes bacterium TaxID=157466 RepID=A0A6J4ICH6_9BACT|nr:hypothetical protein AVDCRST_MAG63-1799 [uncultured Armatimonadetes bacterium]